MSNNSPTSAPDTSASLTLTPPEPVAAITDGEAAAMVRIDPATASKDAGAAAAVAPGASAAAPAKSGGW